MDVVCLFSTPIEREYLLDTQVLMMSVVEQTQSPKVDYYTSSTISDMAVDYIQKQEKPFFMMLNFTNVDYFGARYRDGADVYSKAIKNTDAALGKIINSLKEKGQFESTEFLMTTNYGYQRKTPFPLAESWVVSTQKALRKGTLNDIFPSLLDLLDIETSEFNNYLNGVTLFKVI